MYVEKDVEKAVEDINDLKLKIKELEGCIVDKK